MSEIWQGANNKQELLESIWKQYARLVALVEDFSPEEREKPLSGKLSLKDILAHIADWQAYKLHRIRAAKMGEVLPLRVGDGDIDRENAALYEAHKDRDWSDVWQDFARNHEEMLAEVRSLSESELFDPALAEAVVGIPGDTAAHSIEGDSSNHYWEHANEIEARAAGERGNGQWKLRSWAARSEKWAVESDTRHCDDPTCPFSALPITHRRRYCQHPFFHAHVCVKIGLMADLYVPRSTEESDCTAHLARLRPQVGGA